MDKVQTLGMILLAIGVLTLPLYGVYLLYLRLEETIMDIPLLIRIGLALIFSGFVVLIFSLIRERIEDWKKGR